MIFIIITIFLPISPIYGSHQLSPRSTSPCKRYSFSNRPSQDCVSLRLSTMPDLLPDIISLSLTDNMFPVITEFPESYNTLLSLRVDRCGVEKVSKQALASLHSLRTLDLSHNNIQHIIFTQANSGLVTINLSYNQLKVLPDFSALTSLRLLDLSHNILSRVAAHQLPPNVESIRLMRNQLTHLTPWAFLHKLQELDVSFNPLVCECPLWQFISWAENLALFDSTALACEKPTSLRKERNTGKNMCGPEIWSEGQINRVASLGDSRKFCCLVASFPAPRLQWTRGNYTLSQGISQKLQPDTGRVQYCLEIREIRFNHFGNYTCSAELAGVRVFKSFVLERARLPIIMTSPDSIAFYCQFSILVFLAGILCACCCYIRKSSRGKLTPDQKEYGPAQSVQVLSHNGTAVRSTSTYCQTMDTQRVQLWQQRIQSVRAPLADFDSWTNIMAIKRTSV